MKKYLVFLLCFPVFSHAQKNIALTAQSSYSTVGLNFGLSIIRQHTDKLAFTGGLNYLVNRPITDNRGFAFRHRFYAVKTYQAIGVQLGIRRNIILPDAAIEPYFFYTLQTTHAPIRTLSQYIDTTTIYMPNPQIIQVIESRYTTYPKSVWSFENIIGLGFTTKIHGPFYLNAAAGIGPMLILMPSSQTNDKSYGRFFEIGDYFTLGITYRLKPKT
jgi:hypothetical protein